MTRRDARETAFILIFEKEFNDSTPQEIAELAKEVRDIKINAYVEEVFFGVFEKLEEIDKLISDNAVGWDIKRITKTSLAVLRLAIYEMLFVDSVPVSVSINEAVEIIKKYAGKEDSAFVNGILSTVAKTLEQ